MAEQHTERGFDRVVNFSDAVVAFAITLLVVPLLNLELEDPQAGAWKLIAENGSAFWSFLVSFLLVAMYWLIHHRVFETIKDYDSTLVRWNMLWLVFIVLLPFLSYLVQADGFAKGTGALYLGNMAALSLILGVISLHVREHPELRADHVPVEKQGVARAWVFGGYFALLAVLSIWFPDQAAWAILGVIILGRLFRQQDGEPTAPD